MAAIKTSCFLKQSCTQLKQCKYDGVSFGTVQNLGWDNHQRTCWFSLFSPCWFEVWRCVFFLKKHESSKRGPQLIERGHRTRMSAKKVQFDSNLELLEVVFEKKNIWTYAESKLFRYKTLILNSSHPKHRTRCAFLWRSPQNFCVVFVLKIWMLLAFLALVHVRCVLIEFIGELKV